MQSSNPKRMASRVSGGAEVGWAAADIGVALAAAVAADTARSIPSIAVAPRRSNVAALAASSSDMSSVSVRKAATATGEKRGAARVPADGAAGGGGAECGAPLIVLVRSSGSTGDVETGVRIGISDFVFAVLVIFARFYLACRFWGEQGLIGFVRFILGV